MNSIAESLTTFLNHFIKFALLLIVVHAGAIFTTVHAQEVEEVVVEAEASDSDPLDDLVSANVLDGEKIADAGIEDVEDVAAYVPNLTLTQTGTSTQVCIRGICQGLNQGIDPSVGLYVDKVPYPRSNMARAPFLDLAGVQVLRGPQYATDGNYSIAGSIHLLTNLAVDEFKAGFDFVHKPSQNDAKILLTLGGPINDQWASNLVIQRQFSEGYVDNVARSDSGPAKDELLARWVLGYRPNDDLSFKLKVESGRFDTTGRQTEIIYAEKTPFPSNYEDERYLRLITSGTFLKVNEISEEEYTSLPGNHFDLEDNPGGNLIKRRRVATGTGTVAGAFEAPEDFLYRPLRVPYDAASCNYTFDVDGQGLCQVPGTTFDPDDLESFFDGDTKLEDIYQKYGLALRGREFYYAGRSYQEKLEELYLDNGYEVPRGLLDSELDFTRAADAPEKSENDSINVTLNTELQLGEGILSLTTSYIDYEQVDLIDGDELPVNMLLFDQKEEYSQEFYRLDFKSGQDGFLTYQAGISHMRSDLAFEDQLNFGLENFGNLDGNALQLDLVTPATFDPELPLRAYLGGTRGGNLAVAQLQRFGINRQFDQDADISAAFFQGTFNWRDDLRTTLGLRYTVSEKSAVRDSVIVDPDTGEVPLQFIRDNALFFGSVSAPLLQFFNLQVHTDRFLPLADDQPDRVDELTLGPALGDLSFPGGTSDCLDLIRNDDGDVVSQTNSTGAEAYCFDSFFRTARAISGTRKEEVLLPSIALEWDATQDLSLIGAVRVGNKLGGFDARSTTRPDLPATGVGAPGTFEFEDETAVTYELLARWFLPLEYGGLLNATFYVTDYTDLQFTRLNGATGQNVENAGEATTVGVEIDGYINLTERLNINYSMAWTDFEFGEYLEGPCYLGERADYFLVVSQDEQLTGQDRLFGLENRTQIFIDYDGRPDRLNIARNKVNTSFASIDSDGGELIRVEDIRAEWDSNPANQGFLSDQANNFLGRNSYDLNPFNQPAFCDRTGSKAQYVADWQGTVSINYTHDISQRALLKPTLDIIYNSGYFTTSTLDPDLAQDEYVQFNGRLEIADADERWVFAVTGENLTNEKIVSYAREIFGSRTQGAKVASGVIRAPRTFGLNVRYTFY